ncbi:hypothetical protein SAMN05216576_107159 [Ectopseudomonas chengduensis]|uniref:Uncharacterized protein n=1 Tax=Ectopseudomonas chengduensis TaxID=489632 RepID=A0A1G6PY56_9GAMM|nr:MULTISPECIES: hypothetical protein [Pseudomonas]MBP3061988.1 hypothetical protein [Pseudomonas chengduensis]NNB75282.1 hypothetical protein [Pseudomonas chengduensis]OEO24478.1 hypothetical protein AX279_17570 [Pseudomonas sp. J237]SDC85142.1 hypothetical protein SAMN05216576_107159 [Pseudomonas chengduensis]
MKSISSIASLVFLGVLAGVFLGIRSNAAEVMLPDWFQSPVELVAVALYAVAAMVIARRASTLLNGCANQSGLLLCWCSPTVLAALEPAAPSLVSQNIAAIIVLVSPLVMIGALRQPPTKAGLSARSL